MEGKQRYQDGMAARYKVLDDARIDRTLQHLTPLNDELQDFITRYVWGGTQTRPGLNHHTHSMIIIAILTILNCEVELKTHLRVSFSNRVTRDKLKELIIHSALYYGSPAANTTIRSAQQVFDDIGAAQGRVAVRVGLPGSRYRLGKAQPPPGKITTQPKMPLFVLRSTGS